MTMTLKSRFAALALLIGLLISGCGGDPLATGPYQLNSADYATRSAGTLQHHGSSVEGSGSLIFISPLAGIPSKDSYALQFSLTDQGSLTLVTHSDDQLNQGINLVFTRNGSSLTAIIQAGGINTSTFTLGGVDASSTTQLQVDLHNDESPAHILIWNGSNFAKDEAIYDSEIPGMNAPGNGAGSYWGLVLSNAKVGQATVGPPKFIEGL